MRRPTPEDGRQGPKRLAADANPNALTDIVDTFANTLYLLNYRWNSENLALWKGLRRPFDAYRIYDDCERFLTLRSFAELDRLPAGIVRTRLRHAFIDHYLQRALLPHESEMRRWMNGAAAEVDHRRIYLRDVIPWCQKNSTPAQRRQVQKEIRSLCRFLKPFALNYWEALLDILSHDFGFGGYVNYCRDKKGIDYPAWYENCRRLLEQTEALYFDAMNEWTQRTLGAPLRGLTRFDAIHLLGLKAFDPLFPRIRLQELTGFFALWGMDVNALPGLYLEIDSDPNKSAQAMSFMLQVPEEVYVMMKPCGGWIDLETLWHELGHGLSAVFTSPELSLVERDLATDFSLSEAFAFLLQHQALSPPFLETFLHLSPADARTLHAYKVLKDLAGVRRYAAKFIAEFEMFSRGELADGQRYADIMAAHTGFYHQPESHLFDLSPEFYSLDYVLGWISEAMLTDALETHWSRRWVFAPQAVEHLKSWWAQGNRDSVENFIQHNLGRPLSTDALLERWHKELDR